MQRLGISILPSSHIAVSVVPYSLVRKILLDLIREEAVTRRYYPTLFRCKLFSYLRTSSRIEKGILSYFHLQSNTLPLYVSQVFKWIHGKRFP